MGAHRRPVAARDLAVRLLGDRLRPTTQAAGAAALVRQLDADAFKEREAAENELRALGSRAEPALAAALAGQPSAEFRNRAERLRSALSPTSAARGEDLRGVRAVAVLEVIGTPEARKLLERLSTGEPGVRLTREAATALARLGGR